MTWILLAIAGYLALALVGVIDKLLLSNFIKDQRVYVFYISILGSVVLLAAPFGFYLPETNVLLVSLLSGFVFMLALLAFFKALKIGEASRIIPMIGGLAPLFVFLISFVFLGERLTAIQILAFVLLVLGAVIIGYEKDQSKISSKRGILIAVLATFLMAVYFVASKYAYDNDQFINAFIWQRIGSLAIVPLLLAFSNFRKALKANLTSLKVKIAVLFLSEQALGGLGFVSLSYAISLQSVSLVNALQGVQYALVLIIASLASIFLPQLIREELTALVIIQKIAALLLIAVGLYLAALA